MFLKAARKAFHSSVSNLYQNQITTFEDQTIKKWCVLPLQAAKQSMKKNSSYCLYNLTHAQAMLGKVQNKNKKL